MREIIVNAYHKSGTTWLLHLLCDILEAQHQDAPEMMPLSYGHPTDGGYIIRKKHMPHWPEALPYLMDQTVILTQRDPRDVVVSAMFYRNVPDLRQAIEVMIKSSYVDWLNSWLKPQEPLKVKQLVTTRYEDLHEKPVIELDRICKELSGGCKPIVRIKEAVVRQSFGNMVKQLNSDRYFMRKGIVGDWRNHFTRELAEWFNDYYGEFMLENGYVDSLDWWMRLE